MSKVVRHTREASGGKQSGLMWYVDIREGVDGISRHPGAGWCDTSTSGSGLIWYLDIRERADGHRDTVVQHENVSSNPDYRLLNAASSTLLSVTWCGMVTCKAVSSAIARLTESSALLLPLHARRATYDGRGASAVYWTKRKVTE